MTEVVKISEDQYPHCLRWCLENLGPLPARRNGCERWGVDLAVGRVYFYFDDPRDATLFILRWM